MDMTDKTHIEDRHIVVGVDRRGCRSDLPCPMIAIPDDDRSWTTP
jgi:hypothetical protein